MWGAWRQHAWCLGKFLWVFGLCYTRPTHAGFYPFIA